MKLVKVIRELENGERFDTKCFYDNGWYTSSFIRVNDVVQVIEEKE